MMSNIKSKIMRRVALIPIYFNSVNSFNPTSISLGINSICNAKCAMCDIGLTNRGLKNINTSFTNILNRKKTMSLDNIKLIISKVKSFKPEIHINATEPLLHPNIGEIIDLFRDNNMNVMLTTNGFLLKNKVKEIAESKLNTLCLSIDGYPKIHNKVRGIPNLFEKIVLGVNELRKLNKNINIRVNLTVSPLNYKELYKSVKEINKTINPSIITIGHMNFITEYMANCHNNTILGKKYLTQSTCVGLLNPKTIDINILFDQLDKLKTIKNIIFYPKLTKTELNIFYKTDKIIYKNKKCSIPWNHIQISADGEVYAMTRCFSKSFGNILIKDFDEIWQGAEIKNFRKCLLKGTMPACARCCAIF